MVQNAWVVPFDIYCGGSTSCFSHINFISGAKHGQYSYCYSYCYHWRQFVRPDKYNNTNEYQKVSKLMSNCSHLFYFLSGQLLSEKERMRETGTKKE